MLKRIFAAMLLLSLVFTYSCKKEQDNNTDSKKLAYQEEVTEPEFEVQYFLTNQNDIEDQNVNYGMYYIAEGFKAVLQQQPDLLNEIQAWADRTNAYEVDVNAFVEEHPEILAALNKRIAELADLKVSSFNYQKYLADLMQYKGETYLPFIYIPNHKTADYGKEPYISMNTQIDENAFPEKEDHLPAWYYENGDEKFCTLGEADAMNSTRPVLIFNNGVRYENEGIVIRPTITFVVGDDKTKNPSVSDLKYLRPTFHQEIFRITRPHENSGNVEYGLIWGTVYSTPTEYRIGSSKYTLNRNTVIAGSPVQKWQMLQPADGINNGLTGAYNPFSAAHCESFIASYEDDWGASKKRLGSLCIDGSPTEITGRMKHSTDWYHFDPATNDGFTLVPDFPNNYHINYYWSPAASSEYMKIWRLD